jgi:hypothetical protein
MRVCDDVESLGGGLFGQKVWWVAPNTQRLGLLASQQGVMHSAAERGCEAAQNVESRMAWRVREDVLVGGTKQQHPSGRRVGGWHRMHSDSHCLHRNKVSGTQRLSGDARLRRMWSQGWHGGLGRMCWSVAPNNKVSQTTRCQALSG